MSASSELLNKALYAAALFKLSDEFLRQVKKSPDKHEISQLKTEATASAKASVDAMGATPSMNSTTEVLLKQAGIRGASLEDLLSNANTMPLMELQQSAGYLKRQFCFFINQTKNFNGGKIPAYIAPSWNDTCCESGQPIYKF